jgi:cytochrome b6-f complex iron-sulfur subunit
MRSVEKPGFTRRKFFSWLAVAWGAFAASMSLAAIASVRFLFPNVLFESPSTFQAGFPEDYAVGKVDTRWKEEYRCWMIRDTEIIYCLNATCTHLGCTPNWMESEQKFKCPCHGSGFYITGINFEGPAPRPLERFQILLAENGVLMVDKSKVYQQEKGEWKDPQSYVRV